MVAHPPHTPLVTTILAFLKTRPNEEFTWDQVHAVTTPERAPHTREPRLTSVNGCLTHVLHSALGALTVMETLWAMVTKGVLKGREQGKDYYFSLPS